MIRNVWFIAFNDTRFMLREKATLLWLFLMPLVFFYFIGTVTSSFGGSSGAAPARLYLEVPSPQPGVLDLLLERLEAAGFVLSREVPGERRVRMLEIPDDFEARLASGQPTVLQYRGDPDSLQSDYDWFRLRRSVYTLLADLIVLKSEEQPLSASALRKLRTRSRSVELEVSSAGYTRRIPSGFQQAVPGILVMFTLLVVLTSGATLLIVEREKGLLLRLAATPIPRRNIVLGKWLGRMILALIQIGFAMLAGRLLFSMNWGSNLGIVLVLLLFWGSFCASCGLLLGNLARTQGQAVALGVLAANLLAALGGCWWPIEITPQWMQTLQLAIPSGWTMNALHQLINFGADWTAALPSLFLLALGSLILGALGVRTFRYQ